MKKILFACALLLSTPVFSYVIMNTGVNTYFFNMPIIFSYRQMDGSVGISHCYPRVKNYDPSKNLVTLSCDFETDIHDYVPYVTYSDIK